MDQKIIEAFEATLDQHFTGAVISNSTDKERSAEIRLRPVLLKGELYFQVSEYRGDKVFHSNHRKDELIARLPEWFEGLYRQVEINTRTERTIILISKKGKATVNRKKGSSLSSDDATERKPEPEQGKVPELYLHNKKKNYILEEGTALPFLVDLGVMTQDGKVVKAMSDKFRQINRFLEFIEDILPYLDRDRELTILDFGCGKSYLTFAMYYYLKEMKSYRINVVGLDLKEDVIMHCNKLSRKYGYDRLTFLQGNIASYEGKNQVDMVVSLHACDTATDYALYKAITWGARVILSVPCCQHELNGQIHNEVLQPILKYGIIRERISALITDALRAELLETMDYRVQLLEFIDMQHTPKNLLIRAVKREEGGRLKPSGEKRLKECMEFLGVSPSLEGLIQNIKSGEEK